jgi:predicted nucleic acid-binding protein
MSKQVYIETSIPSYLVARPSRDLLQAARQQLTHDWWNHERDKYNLVISQMVVDEAADGDPEVAERRLEVLKNCPLLDLSQEVNKVARAIMESALLPQKAVRDAIHIAVASVHQIDILLTWNCRHIANAAIMKELGDTISSSGYEMPILCTPEELMGS